MNKSSVDQIDRSMDQKQHYFRRSGCIALDTYNIVT